MQTPTRTNRHVDLARSTPDSRSGGADRGCGRAGRLGLVGLVVGPLLGLTGCVERTVSITSEPSGALVYLNDREIGRTPLETGFVHYGTFDVRLVRDGYEPLITIGEAKPPVWDTVPLDFFAEIAPLPLNSRIAWHYELEPVRDDPAGLLERAGELRSRLPVPADAAADDSAAETPIG